MGAPGPEGTSEGIVVGLRGGTRIVCMVIVDMEVIEPGVVSWFAVRVLCVRLGKGCMYQPRRRCR